MPLSPRPPHRDKMTEAEKQIRDKIIRRWMERHAVYRNTMDNGFLGQTVNFTYWSHRQGHDKWIYTTGRMFDGKFWSFRYRWNASRKAYVLVRSSLRRHAKRKDASRRSEEEARG